MNSMRRKFILDLVKSLTHTYSNPNYGFLIKAMYLLLISVMGCGKEQKTRLKFKIFQTASFFFILALKKYVFGGKIPQTNIP